MATRPGPRPHSNAAIDAAVGEAIKAVRLLDVTYVSRRDEETRRRRLAPYGILSGIRRYVVARDVDAGDDRLRMFRLDAMEQADVSDVPFVRERDFDLRAFANRAFGIFQSEDEYGEIVWRFSRRAASHARGFVFHPEQVLEEQPDGSLVVRFHAAGHLEMCWYLYAWGDQVEVLAPQRLKEMCESHRRSDFPAFP